MKTTTRRLPKTLKKKLEANLTSLTPRQAGRLWLIYFREASIKKDHSLDQYPPVKELFDAWDKRHAEARKKGIEEGNRVGALYNGFIFLANLSREANRHASSDSWRVVFAVAAVGHLVEKLIERDWGSEVARRAIEALIDQAPLPVSRDDYRVMLNWSEAEALTAIDDATETIMKAWAKNQGFVELKDETIREELTRTHAQAVEDIDAETETEEEENEALRRLYAEALGDRFLTDVFKGDREALEDWAKSGGFAGPGLTVAKWNAETEKVEKQLIDMIKAGDLEGGLATYPDHCFDAVLTEEGKIPAWAILRWIWRSWLYGRDHLVKDTPTLTPDTIRGVWKIYNAEGDVEGEALGRLARAFFEDCKAKPWGEGLIESSRVDFDALARFLIEDANPLTQYHAPDLGFVDPVAFGAAEFNDEIALTWVATVRSLKAKAADFGVKPEAFDRDWVKEYYYPVDKPEDRRAAIATVTRLLRALRVSHRAFTYGRKNEDQTKIPLNAFFGESFATPLELAVKQLGEAFGTLATFKRTYELISEEYFGGFNLLIPETVDNVDLSEELLLQAEDALQTWLVRIENTWPDVDLSSLRLVKAEANKDNVKKLADMLIEAARRALGPNTEIDLGPDDEEPIKIRQASRRKRTPVEVLVDAEGSEEA